jgi:hypothetical protein
MVDGVCSFLRGGLWSVFKEEDGRCWLFVGGAFLEDDVCKYIPALCVLVHPGHCPYALIKNKHGD